MLPFAQNLRRAQRLGERDAIQHVGAPIYWKSPIGVSESRFELRRTATVTHIVSNRTLGILEKPNSAWHHIPDRAETRAQRSV
jgi:hypothetical protein